MGNMFGDLFDPAGLVTGDPVEVEDFSGTENTYSFLGLDPAGVASGTGLAGGDYGENLMVAGDPLDIFGYQQDIVDAEAQTLADQAAAEQQKYLDDIAAEFKPYSEIGLSALNRQAGLAGLMGEEDQNRLIAGIEADPLYQAKVRAGDEAVLRNASATGNLRSGNAQSALATQNQNLLSNEIENNYNRLAGLTGLGFQSRNSDAMYTGQGVNGLTGTLGTQASGLIAGEAARQDKIGGIVGGVASMFSDERLKKEIVRTGEKHGLPWYKWKWNETAEKLFGVSGESEGHLAGEVEQKYPDLVGYSNGYKTVNYGGFA